MRRASALGAPIRPHPSHHYSLTPFDRAGRMQAGGPEGPELHGQGSKAVHPGTCCTVRLGVENSPLPQRLGRSLDPASVAPETRPRPAQRRGTPSPLITRPFTSPVGPDRFHASQHDPAWLGAALGSCEACCTDSCTPGRCRCAPTSPLRRCLGQTRRSAARTCCT